MRILVYLWYLSVQMQFRLHLHMHGRPVLKNLDPIGCPRSGTNRHWGPFRGPASALGYGGT